MALTVTVAGATSNSYLQVAEVTSYFAVQPNRKLKNWTAFATDAVREELLKLAAQAIDQASWWHGSKAIIQPEQAMEFPRNYMSKDGGVTFYIPPGVKYAQAEMAVWLSESVPEHDVAGNIASMTIGSFSVSMNGGAAAPLPNQVLRWLQPFINRAGRVAR